MRFDEQDLERFSIKPTVSPQERAVLRQAIEASAPQVSRARDESYAIFWLAAVAALALGAMLYFHFVGRNASDPFTPRRMTADDIEQNTTAATPRLLPVEKDPLWSQKQAVYLNTNLDGTLLDAVEAPDAIIRITRQHLNARDYIRAAVQFDFNGSMMTAELEIYQDGAWETQPLASWLPDMADRTVYYLVADVALRMCDNPPICFIPPFVVTECKPAKLPFDINHLIDACDRDFLARFDASHAAANAFARNVLQNHADVTEADRQKNLDDTLDDNAPGLHLKRYGRDGVFEECCAVEWTESKHLVVYRYDRIYVAYWGGDSSCKSIINSHCVLAVRYEFDSKGSLQEVQVFGPKEAVALKIDRALQRKH